MNGWGMGKQEQRAGRHQAAQTRLAVLRGGPQLAHQLPAGRALQRVRQLGERPQPRGRLRQPDVQAAQRQVRAAAVLACGVHTLKGVPFTQGLTAANAVVCKYSAFHLTSANH